MATLSLCMRDDLKQKVQQLAKEQDVSLNGFVDATIAAAVAQQEVLFSVTDYGASIRMHFTSAS